MSRNFGITGGVGMGKSTSAQLLRARGVAVIDTDDLARQVVAPGQPALNEIQAAFGPGILDPAGQLRRADLARLVFADAVARQRLEQILHPPIRQLWLEQVAAWVAEGKSATVVVIPLLFETKAQGEFDATICVACRPETQRWRLRQRGWSPEQIDQRIKAQLPIDEKIGLADYLIWTEGSLELHAAQLERVFRGAFGSRPG